MSTLSLVPRTRSSHHIAAGTVASFGFKRGTGIMAFPVPFSIPKFARKFCKIVAAAALDVLFAFVLAEYVVGYVCGKFAKGGFALTGVPALFVLGAIALYFVVCTRLFGGTVWQRALGLR